MSKKYSKRYREAAELVEDRKYSLEEAIEIIKKMPPAKFDETVEVAAHLSTDPKKNDQQVRGTTQLPHGTGKTRRVAVFCKGEAEIKAKEAGADFVGGEDLIKKVEGGWLEFDVAIATPDMMREVSKLGRVLGPRGIMPNPKTGTVTMNVAKAIEDVRAGQVAFKSDKLANIQVGVGKCSFEPKQLLENAQAVIHAILHAKPVGVKGKLVKSISLSSTMSPGVAINLENIE